MKFFEHFLQRFLRGDVQVVGRLVEQQEVGPLQRQDGQRQAGALAAAQGADRFEDVLAAEQVLRQVVARLLGVHFLVAEQLIQHRAVAVRAVVRLGKIADLQAGAQAGPRPCSGSSCPSSTLRKVVLPLPLGPISAAHSPRRSSRFWTVKSALPG